MVYSKARRKKWLDDHEKLMAKSLCLQQDNKNQDHLGIQQVLQSTLPPSSDWLHHIENQSTTFNNAKGFGVSCFSKDMRMSRFMLNRCEQSLHWQPHNHINWATPMPFASINSTNPRTNPWNFHEKILRIGGAGKWGFFESAILNFFFQDIFFFCFISMKTSSPFIWGIIYFCNMDGFFRILEKTSFQLICTRLLLSGKPLSFF